jgi:hypothetical protein
MNVECAAVVCFTDNDSVEVQMIEVPKRMIRWRGGQNVE